MASTRHLHKDNGLSGALAIDTDAGGARGKSSAVSVPAPSRRQQRTGPRQSPPYSHTMPMRPATGRDGLKPAEILVIDAERETRLVIEEVLRMSGYYCRAVSSAKKAVERLLERPADVVVIDMGALGPAGAKLTSEIRERFKVEVIMLTSYGNHLTYEYAVSSGAIDFVEKPVRVDELLVRIERVLRERALLDQRNQTLSQLQAAHRELHSAYLDTIHRLVLASEYRDDDTGDHITRMGRYSALVALKLGLGSTLVHDLRHAAPMHDLGKIGIPDHILRKPTALVKDEFQVMKSHPLIGAGILANSRSSILRLGQQICLFHHENWDGSGYPHGLAGGSIPLPGRIVRIVDSFDALTSVRPYKAAYPLDLALEIIRRQRGSSFDPDLTDLILANADALAHIRADVASGRGRDKNASYPSMRDRN
ncbi:MAG: response regulator, partial [Chitinivibrionales bacterium]|nr:response regulator [Chitinivibrionales bacterium]